MSWTIHLSFFLITMTQHFCNHLGYSSFWVSPSDEAAWMTFHFLSFRRNGSLCVQGCSLRRIAERISTSVLVTRSYFSFFTWLTYHWPLKFCEQFVTGPELFFVIRNCSPRAMNRLRIDMQWWRLTTFHSFRTWATQCVVATKLSTNARQSESLRVRVTRRNQ